MAFILPNLPYAPDALEPYIDARTMEIHHDKHHAAYTNNLNAAVQGTALESLSIEQILAEISKHGMPIRNNGGGFWNHNFFWEVMASPSNGGGGEPGGALSKAINETFGSFEDFKKAFSAAATTRFGSGWAWLIKKADGSLAVSSTPNQDNPLMDVVAEGERGTPLLGLDVWEHAYYLNYQNRRPDYIASFFQVVNWSKVAELYGA